MKIKTSEATDRQLNWAVTKCKGIKVITVKGGRATFSDPADDGALNEMPINYSTDWAQGGPIIEQFEIDLKVVEENVWQASNVFDDMEFHHYTGPTPLIAAMRCYVASKLGDEIDVPDELTENTK